MMRPIFFINFSFCCRPPTRLQGDRMVGVERVQQVMRNRRDAAAQGSPEAREEGRPSLSTAGGDEVVRFGEVMQQGVFQLVISRAPLSVFVKLEHAKPKRSHSD